MTNTTKTAADFLLLKQELAEMRKALEHYADGSIYATTETWLNGECLDVKIEANNKIALKALSQGSKP